MAITQTDSGAWLLDLTLGGRGGKRVRRQFPTKEKARRFEALLLTDNQDALLAIDKTDKRRLTDLIQLWYQHHGISLKDGQARLNKLNNLAKALDNPIGVKFKTTDFTAYRAIRLQAGITANTLNHELAYLRAVFNELIRIGEWKKANPLNVRAIKYDDPELTYLNSDEITALLSVLDGDCYKISLVCLSTGARWSEAEMLRAEQIQPYRITFSGTKSGKLRTVPISSEIYELLMTKKTGRLFKPSYDSFRRQITKSKLELPQGQLTHVLRHSFASHFIMNGGNILTLQKILGHSTLTMTLRYAHLAPEHLQEAVRFNPVVILSSLNKINLV